jgi:hypothetical protein
MVAHGLLDLLGRHGPAERALRVHDGQGVAPLLFEALDDLVERHEQAGEQRMLRLACEALAQRAEEQEERRQALLTVDNC